MKTRGSRFIDGVIPKGVLQVPVIFCGTRTFDDYDLFRRKAERVTYWFGAVEVVVGGKGKKVERGGDWRWVGADACAFRWAEENWWTRKVFWPDWDKHGKKAGPLRNREMAEYASTAGGYCVAFWDGHSPGTKSMIDEFLALNPRNRLRIVRY